MDDNSIPIPAPLRAANPGRIGQNGFKFQFTEQVDSSDKHALQLALDRHRVAQRILETKGRAIPRFDTLHFPWLLNLM